MTAPFDQAKLDALMDRAGIDLVLATSRHNVRYLLGGYEFFFFANAEAIGLGRYLPIVAYAKGRPADAFYVGAGNEAWQQEVTPVWLDQFEHSAWTPYAAATSAARRIAALGLDRATIAVEGAFLPVDAMEALRQALPAARFVEAGEVLEELRAVKSPRELALMREASEAIVAAMLSAIGVAEPGVSEFELVAQVRQEQARLGLAFDYCLITSGPTFGRAPSPRRWREGEVLSLDAAGYRDGYLGDLARMGVMGPPTPLMEELLTEVLAVQAAARRPIRAGALGAEVYAAARAELDRCPHRPEMWFLAHGMGLIPHEAPRLTDVGPIPYPAAHRDRPLEAGMVLSVESQVAHPAVGFVKLEDTVVVTETGAEGLGDGGRGWNVAGDRGG